MLKFKDFSSVKLNVERKPGKIEEKYFNSHPFNNSIHLLTNRLIQNIKVPTNYYAELELINFCQLKSHDFIAKSMGTFIDIDDVFVFYYGKMIFNLTEESFSRLGLMGKKSKISKNRYIVSFDLNDEKNSKPGNKVYERILNCLSNFKIAIPFILTKDLGTEINVTFEQKFIDKNEYQGNLFENLSEYLEDAGIEKFNQLGKFLLKAKSHIPCSENIFYVYKWQGLLESSFIHEIYETQLEGGDEFILLVNGFEDSPISWREKEHGYWIGSGENDYLILAKDEVSVLFQAVGKQDQSL